MVTRKIWPALCGTAWVGLALVLAAGPAHGQVPEPRVADINDRSGLLSRSAPIQPTLPHDPARDTFFDTRWADYPEVTPHVNCYRHNGIYGLRWGGPCTACVYPYFYGSPGENTLTPDCRPHSRILSRWVMNYFHPFKPVGSYYSGGSYVPIYDLDPIAPGPGPFPWPHFLRGSCRE